jgi:hypothetical protein
LLATIDLLYVPSSHLIRRGEVPGQLSGSEGLFDVLCAHAAISESGRMRLWSAINRNVEVAKRGMVDAPKDGRALSVAGQLKTS